MLPWVQLMLEHWQSPFFRELLPLSQLLLRQPGSFRVEKEPEGTAVRRKHVHAFSQGDLVLVPISLKEDVVVHSPAPTHSWHIPEECNQF